jgi:hypothetical protein
VFCVRIPVTRVRRIRVGCVVSEEFRWGLRLGTKSRFFGVWFLEEADVEWVWAAAFFPFVPEYIA